MFGPIGMPELIIIFVIALIIFGPRKLPDLGKSLGRSLAEFKRASNDLRSTLEEEIRVEDTRPKNIEPEVIPSKPEPAIEPEVIPSKPEPAIEPEVIPSKPEPAIESSTETDTSETDTSKDAKESSTD